MLRDTQERVDLAIEKEAMPCSDNEAAIACYRKGGFEMVGSYEECGAAQIGGGAAQGRCG